MRPLPRAALRITIFLLWGHCSLLAQPAKAAASQTFDLVSYVNMRRRPLTKTPTCTVLQVNSQDSNDRPWISWDSVSRGATWPFSLADSPNTAWGTAVAPPSFDAPSATLAPLSHQE